MGEKKELVKDETKTKNSTIIIIAIFTILIIATCGGLIILSKDKVKDTEKTETVDNAILFNENTMPKIDGSTATQPLIDAYIKDFTGKTSQDFGFEYTKTHASYVKLINGEVDLIIVTEPSEEELALAKEKGLELEVTKVVNEGFVFFVNKSNIVNSLTLEEIQKIYTGEITNWKELGGSNKEIIAYQRPTNSGSQTGLLSLIMKGLPVKESKESEVIETMAGIIEYISNYENGDSAIGYSYYYYANVMYKSDDLKYIAVNGIAPTYETIQNGKYPLLTNYYIVTRKNETNENVSKLKDAMLSDRGQGVATEAGYVPIS